MPLSPIDEDKVPMLHSRSVDYDEVDLEDSASDTTQVGFSSPHKKVSRSPSRSRDRSSSWLSTTSTLSYSDSPSSRRQPLLAFVLLWFRWSMIIFLQALMISLILFPSLKDRYHETEPVLAGKVIETGDDVNGLYKTMSHTYNYLKPDTLTFIPNMTTNANRADIRRNWDNLMPLGSGSVAIPEHLSYPLLGNPITDDPLRSGPLYEASWTHSLHCLYHLVDSYHQLLLLAAPVLPPFPEFDEAFEHTPDPVHYAHCTEYLRNSILCNLDMTLEGSASTAEDKERGQAHVCRNREEAVKWIEDRRVDDRKDIVGPNAVDNQL